LKVKKHRHELKHATRQFLKYTGYTANDTRIYKEHIEMMRGSA